MEFEIHLRLRDDIVNLNFPTKSLSSWRRRRTPRPDPRAHGLR